MLPANWCIFLMRLMCLTEFEMVPNIECVAVKHLDCCVYLLCMLLCK